MTLGMRPQNWIVYWLEFSAVISPLRGAERKHDGLLPTKMRRLKQFDDENFNLRKEVADLRLTNRCFSTPSAESLETCPEAQAG